MTIFYALMYINSFGAMLVIFRSVGGIGWWLLRSLWLGVTRP
jgi:hypothetical protein